MATGRQRGDVERALAVDVDCEVARLVIYMEDVFRLPRDAFSCSSLKSPVDWIVFRAVDPGAISPRR